MEHIDAYITTTNRIVDQINNGYLKTISEPAHTFYPECEGIIQEVMNRQSIASVLVLKVGARVMFTSNKPELGYVNGTLGTIMEFKSDCISILLECGSTIDVKKEQWEQVEIKKHFSSTKKMDQKENSWCSASIPS